MPKRILIFSLAYYPDLVGGAEVAIKEITDRVSGNDVEFDMITLRSKSELPKFEKIGNINVYRVGFSKKGAKVSDFFKFPLFLNKYLFPFLSFFKAVKLNKERKYCFIWAMMANYAGFGALFFKYFYPKAKYLLTLQEGDPIPYIKKRVSLVYPIFKNIFAKADTIQAISNYLADFAKDMGFTGKVVVIPNGVDIENFSKKHSDKEINILNSSTEKKFIITTSRLVVKNAIDDVIKSLLYLPNNYEFVIIGDGPQEEYLKKVARDNLLEDRVNFLGYKNQKDIPKYLKACSVFVRPSLSEGMGNSFIEAMAAEIPVIATDVGGISDFLFPPGNKDGITPTGLFCEVNNPKSIAESVKRLDEEPSLRKEIVKNALEMVKKKYDWRKIATEMNSLFNEICSHNITEK